MSNPWILRARPAGKAAEPPPPPPTLSLLCFAPAGASASLFLEWQASLPHGVQLLAVELPGRGARMREMAFDSMPALLEALLPELLPELTARPFVLFGHSMGSWVAYQLTQELASRGGPLPLKLYASANRSPLLAGAEHDVDPTVMHTLSEDQFWAAMERRYGANPHLEHAALRRRLLPMLQADFRLIETWRFSPGVPHSSAAQHGSEAAGATGTAGTAGSGGDEQPPQASPPRLPCPLAALGATSDVRYTPAQLAGWSACAPVGGYEERWFEGGHTYISSDNPGRRQLLHWLAEDLQRLVTQLPSAGGDSRSSGTAGVAGLLSDAGTAHVKEAASAASVPEAGQTAGTEPAQLPHAFEPAPVLQLEPAVLPAAGEPLQPPPAMVAARWPSGSDDGKQGDGQQHAANSPGAKLGETSPAACWCW